MRLRFTNVRLVLISTLTIFIASCSVNPVTGKKEVTLMSATQEIETGAQNYVPYQQQQGGRYVVDPELTLYVSQVGKRLGAVSGRPQLPYEFVVLNNGVPNAWALPGGKIAINRGLLELLDDESQLAAVLSHEVVHAAARHAAKQMTQAAMVNAGLMAAGVAAQKSGYGDWIAAGAGLGANAWQAHYGRDQELESDEYGVKYMIQAGYDPQGAVELQEKFVALSQGQTKSMMDNLFASHPPSVQRVELNKKLAGDVTGNRNKAAFDKAMKQLRHDIPAYEIHTKAVQLSGKGEFASALLLIDQAIQKQPKEALFYVTKGQLLMADATQRAKTDTLDVFQKAISLNPEYYLGYLGAGLVLKEQKKNTEAVTSLQRSMTLLPTPIASYYLGEYALNSGDATKARSYFEFAAQGQGEIAEMANAQLSKLSPPAPAAVAPTK